MREGTTEHLRLLRLPDERRLAWCERGDPAGTAVFAFHGLPGSRLQAHPDDSIAVRARAFFLDRLLARLPECDREILRKPAIHAMLLEDVAEAFRSGYQGFLQDLRIGARPWDIALEDVSCPVRLWHGDEDTIVPQAASQQLAARIPGSTVSLFPRAGHFFVYAIWGEILEWLVSGRGPT